MTSNTDARQALRTATAADHERVDRAFGAFDLADRAGYTDFLLAQAHAFVPVEAEIDAFDPRHFLPDWDERRRADALRADLVELGETLQPSRPSGLFRSREEILGAIYVLEGSRLGGRMLARSVPADLPQRFLATSGSAMWRNLIEVLDKLLISDDQLKLAIDAARRTFALFEAGALRHHGTKTLG